MDSVFFIRNLIIIIVFADFASLYVFDKKDIFEKSVTSVENLYSTPEECARRCVAGAPPKTCYYHFTVEYYATLTGACDMCEPNSTIRLRDDCQCIKADGYEVSGILTANRMSPGPAILICLGDYAVIDVSNAVPGNAVTIHWHGLLQNDYQYYDGVPFVTQCPIPVDTTFRYQWKAKNAGTHFWHAHTGLHAVDGLHGPLVVREPRSTEPNSKLWDYDDFNHAIFMGDFLHNVAAEHFPGTLVRSTGITPDSILINGMGQWTDPQTGNTTTSPLAVFTLNGAGRYRFRMINSCTLTCPVQLSIEGHRLTVISIDGENCKPVVVDSITSSSAERYDFVINANRPPGDYWIQVRALGSCGARGLQQLAILRYSSAATGVTTRSPPTYVEGVRPGVVLNQLNVRCEGPTNPPGVVCISNLENTDRIDPKLLKKVPDIKLFLPINFYFYTQEELFQPGTYQRFEARRRAGVAAMVANISSRLPPSPLITSRKYLPPDEVCSQSNLPQRCQNSTMCSCIHIEEIPLHSVVELILVDEAQVPNLSHPFHMHGHSFVILGEGCASDYNITSVSLNWAKNLDKNGRMRRRMKSPPAKDSYAVPNNGYTIIRFMANNPGYWLFHCHFLLHLINGMSLVFHVGDDKDLPPVPRGFPTCGNFLPPIVDEGQNRRCESQRSDIANTERISCRL